MFGRYIISNWVGSCDTSMNKEYIKARLIELENYLNKNWHPFDNFVERICARAEYEKLTKEFYGK